MGYDRADRPIALKQFQTDLAVHTTIVNDIFRSFFETPNTSVILKKTFRLIGLESAK